MLLQRPLPVAALAALLFTVLCPQADCEPSRPNGPLGYATPAERFAAAAVVAGSGAHELRIISPDTIELYIVSERSDHTTPPTLCDWINESTGLPNAAMPSAADLAVTAGGAAAGISNVGFKRSVLYAPRDGGDFAIANSLFIKLTAPLAAGAAVSVTNPTGSAWPAGFSFSASFDSERWGPAIHTNQIGYEAGVEKRAHVGYWLGDLGELDLLPGTAFDLIDSATAAVAYSGTLTARTDSGYAYSPPPYAEVMEADFGALTAAGSYRLRVAGLGASMPFEIGAGLDGSFARNDFAGLYHQRSAHAKALPFTRHVDAAGHTAAATVPSNTDRAAFTFMWDFIESQTGGAVTGPSDMLYPYSTSGTIDVSGGHHDAGDYGKYATNSAMAVHSLAFAIDHFGAPALDNLGIPESGDGIGDLLQEAKIEADFLLKMQDSDGGFFLMVRPRERSFEADVLPSAGDEQIVYPKNTTATAAAVAALAEIGSSSAFAAQYPADATAYLAAATSGWTFLQNAITANGLAGSYQKIADVGESWGHDDELAWAAAAMFVATGDPAHQTQLMAWLPIAHLTQNSSDPLFPEIRDFGFKRMAEGWGCALRAYSFGYRSGRLAQAAYDATYLAATDAEVLAAAQDVATWTADTAYGAALASTFKADGAAAFFFPTSEAFDAMVGIELAGPNAAFTTAIRENLNYAAGNNPVDMPYLTGLGWRRQREIVSQFADNDSGLLPPLGVPLGAITTGPPHLPQFSNAGGGNLLSEMLYPNTGSSVFPYYDRWADAANVTQELTIPVLARSAAVTSSLFAAGSLAGQSWTSESATITGIPASTQIGNPYVATISTALPLSDARTTWDATALEPKHAGSYAFSPERPGSNSIAADILLPDGRRAHAMTTFNAVLDVPNPIETYLPDPGSDFDVIAWYALDGDWTDSKALQVDLTPAGGGESFDSTSFSWSNRPGGQALRIDGEGEGACVTIPHFFVDGAVATTISVEAMVLFDDYPATSSQLLQLIKPTTSADLSWQFDENFGGLSYGGTEQLADDPVLAPLYSPNTWHHLRIEISRDQYAGYRVFVDGLQVAEVITAEFSFWDSAIDAELCFGNFHGWIDEVIVRSVGVVYPPVVTLSGDPEVVLRVGDSWSDPGASAVDYLGNALSVTTSGSVDTLIPGDYLLSYEATDARGETGVSTRIVTVQLPPAPGERIAAYRFDCAGADAMGRQEAASLTGSAAIAGGTLILPVTTDAATATIPLADLLSPGSSFGFALEFRLRVDAYASGDTDLVEMEIAGGPALSLSKAGAQGSAHLRTSAAGEIVSPTLIGLPLGSWQHYRIALDLDGYTIWRNGLEITSVPDTDDLGAWVGGPVNLSIGNFSGELDDLVLTNVRPHVAGTVIASLPTQTFVDENDSASTSIAEADIILPGLSSGIALSATITPNSYPGFGVVSSKVLGLEQNWNTNFSLERDTYAASPSVFAAFIGEMLTPAQIAAVLPIGQATSLVIRLDTEGYQVWAGNRLVIEVADSDALSLWENNGNALMEIGHLDGTIANAKVTRLELPPEGHYAAWAFANITLPEERDELDDGDGDGATNLEEFFFGSLPGLASSLPHAQVVVSGGGRFLEFDISNGAGGCTVSYSIEKSPNLIDWGPSGIVASVFSSGSSTDRMRAALPALPAAYYRITVSSSL